MRIELDWTFDLNEKKYYFKQTKLDILKRGDNPFAETAYVLQFRFHNEILHDEGK